MIVRLCDICKKEIKEGEPVTIISIQQYQEFDEKDKEEHGDLDNAVPDMIKMDACDNCGKLHQYAWLDEGNIKAMFLSIKQRQARLGVPKGKKHGKENNA